MLGKRYTAVGRFFFALARYLRLEKAGSSSRSRARRVYSSLGGCLMLWCSPSGRRWRGVRLFVDINGTRSTATLGTVRAIFALGR